MRLSSPEVSPRRAAPAVMLIEAEPMLRLTMTKFLRRSGYHVTACADVRAGAEALADGTMRPSLIVLGARVLDDETAETARRLRELAPRAPMLGIADVIDSSVQDAKLPHGLRFLAPPFDVPDVLRAVRSYLREAGFRLPDHELLEV
jgi:DNA-binding response OmpR family regulator